MHKQNMDDSLYTQLLTTQGEYESAGQGVSLAAAMESRQMLQWLTWCVGEEL